MPRRKQPKHQVLQRPRARRLGEAWRCMLNRAARPAVALQTVAQHSGAEEARETPISRMTAKAALVAAVVAVIQAAVATEEAVAAVAMAVVQADVLAAEMVGGMAAAVVVRAETRAAAAAEMAVGSMAAPLHGKQRGWHRRVGPCLCQAR